jgi:hypothetical protein
MLNNYIFTATSPDGAIQFQWTTRDTVNLGQRAVSNITAKKVAMLQLLGN